MKKHKAKEAQNTIKLLQRSLNYLIKIKIPEESSIKLNGRKYKSISFSAQQVIDAMHELATPLEKPITDRSNFRTVKGIPNEYQKKLNEAKLKRASNDMKGEFISLPKQNISEMEYIQTIKALQLQNNELRTLNADLNAHFKQIEEKLVFEENKQDITILPSLNSSNDIYKLILKDLLAKLSDDNLIVVTQTKGKVKPQLMYDGLKQVHKICDLDEIKDIIKPSNIHLEN